MNNFHSSRLVVVIILAALVILPVVTLSSLFRNAEATTTVISSNTTLPDMTVNAGDTLIINAGVSVTANSITNNGNIVHRGQIFLNPGETIENHGIFLFAGGGIQSNGVPNAAINNHPSGIIKEDTDGGLGGQIILNNYGTFITYSGIGVAFGEINNYETGTIEGHGVGQLHNSVLQNFGGEIQSYGNINIAFSSIINRGTFYNHATIGMQNAQASETIENVDDGIFYNLAGANIVIPSRTGGYVKQLVNSGVFNNEGDIVNHHKVTNTGTFNNEGSIDNAPNGGSFPMAVIDNSGIFNNDGSISNKGVVNNLQSGNFDNDGSFVNECGSEFNDEGTFTGNPVVDGCANFPIIHMQDTTATVGSVTYAGRQINAEYVDATSQLIGDKIDSITLRLQSIGSPPGTFQVGVFNADLTPKKSFEIRSTSTLSTTFQDYEFKLQDNQLYTIQQGDRIGIKYNGGTTSNAISVMTDRNAADPFDGTKSYRTRYESFWILSFSEDLYMILKQTHDDAGPQFPITHMSDATVSFASLISAPRQLMAEFVTPSSQLVGDPIDSINLRLQRVGAATGIAQIGIFNSDLSVKKLFGTIDVSTISTTATEYEFRLLASDPLYVIAAGDRIGIKYTGGSGSVGINVTPDRDAADPFDGTSSYRTRYEASWINSTSEDLYMILKQTHG